MKELDTQYMSIEFLHLSRQKSEVGVADVGVVLNEEVREDVQRNDFLIDIKNISDFKRLIPNT